MNDVENRSPDIVANILHVMNRKGITRGDLIPVVASRSTLERLFCRKRDLDAVLLARIAEALGVSVAEIKTQNRG